MVWSGHDREYTGSIKHLQVAMLIHSHDGWDVYDQREGDAGIPHRLIAVGLVDLETAKKRAEADIR